MLKKEVFTNTAFSCKERAKPQIYGHFCIEKGEPT